MKYFQITIAAFAACASIFSAAPLAYSQSSARSEDIAVSAKAPKVLCARGGAVTVRKQCRKNEVLVGPGNIQTALKLTVPKCKAGPKGEEGSAGDVGPIGDIGPSGPQGDIGLPGFQGDSGEDGLNGAKGISHFETLPSGTTVKGNFSLDKHYFCDDGDSIPTSFAVMVALPAMAPLVLTDADIVNGSVNPALCPGTGQAARGKFCFYTSASPVGVKAYGAHSVRLTVNLEEDGSLPNTSNTFSGSWAYTAP